MPLHPEADPQQREGEREQHRCGHAQCEYRDPGMKHRVLFVFCTVHSGPVLGCHLRCRARCATERLQEERMFCPDFTR